MNIRIFASSVLAKPLNNAQIVRGVFWAQERLSIHGQSPLSLNFMFIRGHFFIRLYQKD